MIERITVCLVLCLSCLMTVIGQSSDATFEENLTQSKLVVVAEIVCVGQGAGFWSGQFPAYQYVKYKIESTIIGESSTEIIGVNHYVVKGSQSSDKATPRLSPELFKRGNKLILFLVPDDGKEKLNSPRENKCSKGMTADYLVFDSDFGAIKATDDLVRQIKQQLGTNL